MMALRMHLFKSFMTKEKPVWNKNSNDNPPAHPEAAAPAWDRTRAQPPAQAREAAPQRQRVAGVIGPSMKIKGEISSEEELYIDGQVEGTLTLQQAVTVGANGKVLANIKARDLTILGSVRGNVELAGKLAIREKGSLVGDVRTVGISIDDGAYFKGGIDIVRPEPVNIRVKAAGAEPA
jgi:cytoskeletal protein CcmA (bactofilin family)